MTQPVETTDRKQLYRDLLDAAKQATKHSYAPFSKFIVGSALRTADGSVYTGCNVENSNFANSICAERTAMVKAMSDGHREFDAIATVSLQAADCWPCGVCRQFLSDFGAGLTVVAEGAGGEIKSMPCAQLLPAAHVPKT
ncbi:MAG TPA: cytidine deaminase [Candidatus Obscuribacterales bacterium]